MTVTLVATAGSASANSYLSVAGGDAIAATMLGQLAWTAAVTDDKARALITATRGLELLTYVGTRASDVQALAWPRSGVYKDGVLLDNTTVPEALQYATFDLAEALLAKPTLLQSDPSTSAIIPGVQNRDLQRLKLDALEIEWRRDGRSVRITPLTVLPHLATMLAGLTTSTPGSPMTMPLVRS